MWGLDNGAALNFRGITGRVGTPDGPPPTEPAAALSYWGCMGVTIEPVWNGLIMMVMSSYGSGILILVF